MSDLRDLYQEVIIDHSKHPRNFQKLAGANRHGEGYNPLCGDKVTMYLIVEQDRIKEVTFEGKGCAISTASASMLTETIKSKTLSEVETLFKDFQTLVTGQGHPDDLGKLEIFEGVSEFPARVKCATLPWHTIMAALKNEKVPVKTE